MAKFISPFKHVVTTINEIEIEVEVGLLLSDEEEVIEIEKEALLKYEIIKNSETLYADKTITRIKKAAFNLNEKVKKQEIIKMVVSSIGHSYAAEFPSKAFTLVLIEKSKLFETDFEHRRWIDLCIKSLNEKRCLHPKLKEIANHLPELFD